MLRLRRYRMLLVCAFVITVLLYHVSKNSQWDHSSELWHSKADPHTQTKPKSPPPPASRPEHDHDHEHESEHQGGGQPQKSQHKPPPPTYPDSHGRPVPDPEPTIRIPQLKTADGVKGGYGLPTNAALPPKPAATVPDRKPPSNHDEYQNHGENAGMQVDAPTPTTVHWQKPYEWFPVPEESLIMLPTGKPKSIPAVQFAFGEESPAAKEKRELRLAKVKVEAQRAWSGYKEFAWTHDELMPVSNKSKDPFCGWAATLVDSLDTLWLMGLKDEFDDAVKAVKEIDFTTTPYREDIPVFETIIRYLGGLIAAYDVTGAHNGKYRVLLDKALELAEILMSVFDTPNRLPILYYNWKPAFNVNPKRASTGSGVAELGTMSMEFTRLAQLTGKDKYYDAIARITDAFEELQNTEGATAIPGIFPQQLDASGCNRTAPLPSTLENSSEAAQKQAIVDDDMWRAPRGYSNTYGGAADDIETNAQPGAQTADTGPGSNTGFHRGPQKRDGLPNSAPAPVNAKGLPADWECVPQGLTGGGWGGSYSMGGSQDSAYEYFPKQYLMLGGLEPKYRTMHEKTADAVKEHLLFRPMAEGDPDVLFSAKAFSTGGTAGKMSYEWEVTHLTCFLGGMFGLGGKIFDRPEDVEVGKKLTDGCVWAYESMPAGVMPEHSTVLPCKKPDDCQFDKAAWYASLDPNAEHRESQMADYYTRLAEWKEQVEELKKQDTERRQAEERKRQAEAVQKAAEDEERMRRLVDNTTPVYEGTPGQKSEPSSPELKQKDTLPATGFQRRDQRDLDASNQKPMSELVLPPAPDKPLTHQEYVAQRLENENIPSGFVTLNDKRYILRPEAIESVWYMYRITGDPSWQEKGWRMFEAVVRTTQTDAGHSAIRDVTSKELPADKEDSMESFWLAETLKYFYLLFETPDVLSLDEWVLNTEAHPFRRPT
ncbi:glycosyl hydrolase family 47-domain-containing protein [Chaetomidium leptoderma]|uniref:alpha-1,2-Mannosidase n=1 Tax=Chaetomidium leptoderma TaxID=669021 RepID=A0AAN6VMX9_9PEZI|nr:glycosyl hydrolase family 47-domain-containing protein [Chaetomidium leptoderma]